MQVHPHRGTLQTPDRLDARFAVVTGLYVATLVSPALLLVVVWWLQLASEPFALGLLGAVGAVVTAVGAWQVTRRGEIAAWVDSPWLASLVPAVGMVPVLAYFVLMVKYLAFTVADFQAETAASLVGFVGFYLGLVAVCLGSVLVVMARARVVDATVDDSDVDVEWTASWPRRDRFRYMVGTLVAVAAMLAPAVWGLGWQGVSLFTPFGLVLVFGVQSLVADRTCRATPTGLVQHRGRGPFRSRQLLPWSAFEGLSVTDDAIVLHRPLPHVDVRCSRRRLLADEDRLVATLDDHLDRRNP